MNETIDMEIAPPSPEASSPEKYSGRVMTISTRRIISHFGSYAFLTIGAIFMLFPVFWMITAALKPTWQVSAPDILLPSMWHKSPAGDSLRLINLWTAPAHTESGEREDVILYGARRQYMTMLDADQLDELISIPRNVAGKIEIISVKDFAFNGLIYQGQQHVLVGVNGDHFLTVPLDSLNMDFAVIIPRSLQRSADSTEVIKQDYALSTRLIEVEGAGELNLVEAGPYIELSSVLPADYAQHIMLVPQSDLGEKVTLPVGESEADLYALHSDPSDERYLIIEMTDWRPVIGYDDLQASAFTIPKADFITEGETITSSSGAIFQLGLYEDQEVALIVSDLIETTAFPTVMVMPVNKLESVHMMVSTSLFEPRPMDINGSTVRVKDFDHPSVEEESTDLTHIPHKLGIVGERQNMALVLPVRHVTEMYDVVRGDLSRKLSFYPRFHNLVRALLRETGGSAFIRFFLNSTIVAVMYIIGHLFSCTVVAYGFARMRAPGRNTLFAILIATLMMPGFITVIPIYRIFRDLNLVDTLWPLFVRGFFGSAFFIFLLRQFFTTIPMELEEAARIDGANRLQIFFRIMLPLITPALATIVIFTFLWSWNDVFNAAIYLNSPQNYTVALGLRQFLGLYSAEFNLLMAAATVVMLPTILLFFFAQRYFIEGITLTGMKG